LYTDLRTVDVTDYQQVYYTNKVGAGWLTPERVNDSTTKDYHRGKISLAPNGDIEAFYIDYPNNTCYNRRNGSWGTQQIWTRYISFPNKVVVTTGDVVHRFGQAAGTGDVESDDADTGYDTLAAGTDARASHGSLGGDNTVYIFFIDQTTNDVRIISNEYNGVGWVDEGYVQVGTFQRVVSEWAYHFENQGGHINYIFDDGTSIYFARFEEIKARSEKSAHIKGKGTSSSFNPAYLKGKSIVSSSKPCHVKGVVVVDLTASRIANAVRDDQSGSDDGDVSAWHQEFILAVQIGTSNGPIASAYKLRWRDVTDAGAFADVGATGEIKYSTDTVLTDGNAVTSAKSICTGTPEPSWQDGLESENDNLLPDSGTYSLADEYYTELQWALSTADGDEDHQYEFELYDVTAGKSVGTCAAQITLSGDRIVDKQVAASADDGFRWNATGFGWTGAYGHIGNLDTYVQHHWARFTGVTIEGTINVSYIKSYCHYRNEDPYLKVYGVDEDNPDAPTTYQEFDADPLTAGIDWDGAWVLDEWEQSPSLNAIFQELVDSHTISNDAVMVQVRDDSSPAWRYVDVRTYDYAGNQYGLKLHIEYALEKSDSKPAYVQGGTPGTPISDSNLAYIKGSVSITDSTSAYIKGKSASSDSQACYAKGSINVVDSVSAYLKGKDTSSSSKPTYIAGGINVTSFKPVHLKGKDTTSDEKVAYIAGGIQTSDSAPAYMKGKSTVSDDVPAHIKGKNTASDSTSAFIKVPGLVTSSKSAYIKGKDTAVDSTLCYIRGKSTASDSKSCYLDGGVQVLDSVPAYLKSKDTASDSKSAYINGGIDVLDSVPTYLKGKDTVLDSVHCYVNGGIQVSDSVPAFVVVQAIASDSQATFVKAALTASSSKPAFLNTWTATSSSKLAYVKGKNTVVGSKTAYIKGKSTVSDSVSAYVLGSADTADSQLTYVKGQAVAIDSKACYLAGSIATSDSIPCYVKGEAEAISSSSCFITGKADATDSQPCHIAGGLQVSDPQSCFIGGVAVAIDSKPAYVNGYLPTITSSRSAYISGFVFEVPCIVRSRTYPEDSNVIDAEIPEGDILDASVIKPDIIEIEECDNNV